VAEYQKWGAVHFYTKSTEAQGVTLDHRVCEVELEGLDVPAHVAELVQAHGPRPLRRCFENAKEQVKDLLLLVDLMRQLSNRQVARTLHALGYPLTTEPPTPDGLAIPSEARKRGIRAVGA
jgi:hypothetical protein